MPKTWAQYKQDQRDRKRAAGCIRLDVILTKNGQRALSALRHGIWRNESNSSLIEAAIIKCAIDAGLFRPDSSEPSNTDGETE